MRLYNKELNNSFSVPHDLMMGFIVCFDEQTFFHSQLWYTVVGFTRIMKIPVLVYVCILRIVTSLRLHLLTIICIGDQYIQVCTMYSVNPMND